MCLEIPLDPYITHVVDTYSSMDHKLGTRCDALLLKKVLSNRLGVDAMGNLIPDSEEDQPYRDSKHKKEPAGLAAYTAAASSSAGVSGLHLAMRESSENLEFFMNSKAWKRPMA